jgi:RNA polymerase sigma-70 factor (ECF subfamily)
MGVPVSQAASISGDALSPMGTIAISAAAEPKPEDPSAAIPGSWTAEPMRASAWIAVVFDELGSRIHRTMLAATRDGDTAAEVTQEAFLRLLCEAQADRYPSTPGAWLYRTAMNLAISRSRRAAVARRLATCLVSADEAPTPEGIVVDRERWRAVGEALGQLSPTHRTALVLAAKGMSGEEIAEHLGKSHGATRALMFRARGRVRRLLEGQLAT